MRGARILRAARFNLIAAFTTLLACAQQAPVAKVPVVTDVPAGSTFILDLSFEHQSKIAVVTPDERWARIIDRDTASSLMSEGEFLKQSRLEINTKTLTAAFSENDKTVNLPVFTSKGLYQFVVTDNLDTEPENMRSVSIRVAYD